MKVTLYKVILTMSTVLWMATGCKDTAITEFGFDGEIAGVLKDREGEKVSGDITSNTLIVRLQGEKDVVTTDIRINGDGSFRNTKLYPQRYKLWVLGPIFYDSDTLEIDLTSNKNVVKDIQVTPFLKMNLPVVRNVTSSEIEINYAISGNEGKTATARELYCSTNPYPTTTTGSGPFFETKKINLGQDSGTVTISGLASNTKYYIRIGALANGSNLYNLSDQIVVTTN